MINHLDIINHYGSDFKAISLFATVPAGMIAFFPMSNHAGGERLMIDEHVLGMGYDHQPAVAINKIAAINQCDGLAIRKFYGYEPGLVSIMISN